MVISLINKAPAECQPILSLDSLYLNLIGPEDWSADSTAAPPGYQHNTNMCSHFSPNNQQE